MLKKSHTIHQTMNHNSGRMAVCCGLQEDKGRDSPLIICLANEVQWNGESALPWSICYCTLLSFLCLFVPCIIFSLGIFNKVMCSNMNMHELSDSLEVLLSED